MGWLEDKYCGATFHLIKFIRDGICKKWDAEHGKKPAPSTPDTADPPAPSTPPPSSSEPSTSPFPPSTEPARPAPSPAPSPSPRSPPPASSDRQASAPSSDAADPAASNSDLLKSNAPPPDTSSPASKDLPFPSSGSAGGNPFPADDSNVNALSAGQTGQIGSMTGVYIGVGVAAAIVVALFVFLGIRVARNRRKRQEEAMAAYALPGSGGGQRDMPPPNLVSSPPPSVAYMREADMEAGASPVAAAAAPMPVYETRNVAPAPSADPYIFDATANMVAAGLDQLNGAAPVPQQNPHGPYANDPVLAAYTNTGYGQSNAMPRGADVAAATTTGMAAEVPDDVFGEHIYGDTSVMPDAATATNVVHSADLAQSPAGVTDAGYCLESLRADSYMNQGVHGESQLNVGTYGSDAVYLDATEEFPNVPAISADDARLRTP
ncbi:hypothetical protein SYNPS1DRAFT_27653 [Syncephalis pseudoplumigaleata]|uniref:Uncharacterized protein n=1 Tax=Syncephalis pseudoplumigaleata TaxID=1712513 RepID=A0A4P9Z3R6_9FUNG|nr:hypothetical protein SYNPS1DRAFT_27653 [Syncephalis pseudoplumigaleata]|eukprot:RKP26672.1 hypothetical protein SYNPS1DRAFT_27653 [Syncephalis pseudoplumigaleata]